MTNNIFINYRREDTLATAGRLYDRLAARFGEEHVFMDVDHIPAGADFVSYLEAQVQACQIMLVIIGPQWLGVRDDANERRIDNQNDFVRIEIASALRLGARVIPILVDSARMPAPAALPDELRALSTKQAIELRNIQFNSDASRLIERVSKALNLDRRRKLLFAATVGGAALAALILALVFWREFGGFLQSDNSQRIAPGFNAPDFRLVERSQPPVCETDAQVRSQPVPLMSASLANLALMKRAKATASSVIQGFPSKHQASFLNDGWYNNCRSWIPATMPAWIELDLGTAFDISVVKFGSEHTPFWRDRAAKDFAIHVRKDQFEKWVTVYRSNSFQIPIDRTFEFPFSVQRAQFVRIDFFATDLGDPVRVDEIEVYGDLPR